MRVNIMKFGCLIGLILTVRLTAAQSIAMTRDAATTLRDHEPQAQVVAVDLDGRLTYRPDDFGNTVPDFSLAGYRNGGVALPVAPVLETLKHLAGFGDDSARIQAAIDRVGQAPERAEDGVRGAVLLTRGAYQCGSTLRVPAGVTLRGEGQDAAGTVITATMIPPSENTKPTLIRVTGTGRIGAGKDAHDVLDEVVPLGAKRMKVAGAASFKPGDTVIVERQPNQQWIHDLKMDQIAKLPKGGKQWTPGGYTMRWQARVSAVEGDTLTLDTPVIFALERRYGGARLFKVATDTRGRGAAVERLRLVSVYEPGKEASDEKHAWNAITMDGLVDSWVREVTALHFAYTCVSVGRSAARVTVQDCAMLDPVSQITGGRRYSFSGSGQFVLFQRCYARNGRHDFVNGHGDVGPTVYLDCLAEQTHADIGPHHRWASGQLYDNVKGGQIHVQDRGRSGTGHGWAGNCQVFWNCEAPNLLCQKAWIPSAQNWAIGCVGRKGKASFADRPDGFWQSLGQHVAPRSLYLAQLKERIDRAGGSGDEAIQAVTTPQQRQGAVLDDLHRRFSESE